MGRRLGQHFLVRPSLIERIAAAACPEPEIAPLLIEIGPGRGALTERLLPRCERLLAIEIDPVLVHYLREKFRASPSVEIVESDILKTELPRAVPLVVAGNLPYYITSPIVERVLALGRNLTRAVFLVQREVAQRMATPPGSREYGYLSVLVQFYARPELLFTIPPGAFRPAPKVESAVIRLTPRETLSTADPAAFLQFASRCFRQKRKTLRNNLKPYYPGTPLDSLSETSRRAEQLTILELVDLQQKLDGSVCRSVS